MNWSDDATEIMAELLRHLPASVRETVEEAAESRAEALTSADGEDEIAMETAVRAVVESTPAAHRTRLREALTYYGIDPEDFEDAFDS